MVPNALTFPEARTKLLGNLTEYDRNRTIPTVTLDNTMLSDKEYVNEHDGDGSNPMEPIAPTQRGRRSASRRDSLRRGNPRAESTRFIRGRRGASRGGRGRSYEDTSIRAVVSNEPLPPNEFPFEGSDQDAPTREAVDVDLQPPGTEDTSAPEQPQIMLEPEKEKEVQYPSSDIRYRNQSNEKGIDRSFYAMTTNPRIKKQNQKRVMSRSSSTDDTPNKSQQPKC